MKIIAYGKTDIGKKREVNEDNFIIVNLDTKEEGNIVEPTELKNGLFFMVADGLGGSVSGEIASKIGIDTASSYVKQNLKLEGKALVKNCLLEANTVCHKAITDNPELKGMGTVGTACLLNEDEIFISQIGDTRFYLFRDDELYQITEDQNYYNEIKRRKIKDPDIIKEFSHKHIVTQAIGSMKKIVPVVSSFLLQPGDKVFICSDGMYNLFEFQVLKDIISYKQSPQKTIEELVDIANENGGMDNITGILVEIL